MEGFELGRLRKGEIVGGLLYWPMYLLGSQILAVLLLRALGLEQDPGGVRLNFAFEAINLVCLTAIFFRYLRDQFRVLLLRGWRLFIDVIRHYFIYFCLSYAVSMAVTFLALLLRVTYTNANQEAVQDALTAVPWASVLMVCVLAPPAEELLCRGLIFCGLYRRSRFWAYAASMLAFSLIHVYASAFGQSLGVSLLSLLLYLPAGYVMARAYERSGTIWTSILLHSTINLLSLLLQGLME